ncbi:hypothetical protein [Streptomyces sp. WAC01526]|uniref:hypothetical protein n=1 Tax=Streptomyces sp. WAC01526 TaxID=2588709 RepID=UPI0011DF2060|nr:hypothetical protein [Streptomyces sp. WAC01526]
MPVQHTIRRATRRLAQLYLDAAKANASHNDIPLAAGPFSILDEARRTGEDQQELPRERTGTRHG